MTVADELNFGRAAERLNVAQSAVSLSIKALEDELGARLFNRNKRSAVTLTRTGEIFLVEARAALAQSAQALNRGRQAARGALGTLEIGYVVSAALSGLVSRAVYDYRQATPGVDIHLRERETPRQLEDLVAGRLDVGFIRSRKSYPDGIAATLLRQDRVFLAVGERHPLAAEKSVMTAALADEIFIVPYLADTGGFREQLDRIAAKGGFSPKPGDRVDDFISALSAVAAGLGVGIIPDSVRSVHMPGVAYLEFSDIELFSDLMLAYRSRESEPVVSEFVRRIVKGSG